MNNVLMDGTGVYIPENIVYNEELERQFEKRGLTAKDRMDDLGRHKRYFISEGENAITMSQNAIDDCIHKNNFNIKEYEMLVVCTDTPEYLSPSNAMRIVGLYGDEMKNIKVAFDLNSNCTGMIQGIDIVSKYMKASNIRKALVVGTYCISPIAVWSDTVVYGTFGDAAACVSLSMVKEEEKRGILDNEVLVDAKYYGSVQYPKCGMAKAPLNAIMPNEKRMDWNFYNLDMEDFIPQNVAETIKKVLNRNAMEVDEIDYFVFSQLNDTCNKETLKLLGVNAEDGKYDFIGKDYGYTGNTCPILCMNKYWNKYTKPGKKVMICTFGAGHSVIAQLYKF